MVHDDQNKTTRLGFQAVAEGYPVESFEARAAWQALVTYGSRVVQIESKVEDGVVTVEVGVAW